MWGREQEIRGPTRYFLRGGAGGDEGFIPDAILELAILFLPTMYVTAG
jgi:hypothetical protein